MLYQCYDYYINQVKKDGYYIVTVINDTPNYVKIYSRGGHSPWMKAQDILFSPGYIGKMFYYEARNFWLTQATPNGEEIGPSIEFNPLAKTENGLVRLSLVR